MKNAQTTGVEALLDDVDWAILRELQIDARIPFAELGRRVGLSSPAVTERVRRLEDAGVITGYHAQVDVTRLGRTISAIIRIGNPGERNMDVANVVRSIPEVLECDRITGKESFVLRVAVSSVERLEDLLDTLEPYGQTTTSLILSSPVERRIIEPLGGG